MSKVAISGNASGTGVFTIASPNSNTDRTLNLPDQTGTVVVTGTTPALNGITFPASQVTSADANTLDDYEEGTFTPTWNGGTVTVNQCNYTKIGRLVHTMYDIQLGSSASSSPSTISAPFSASPSIFYTGVFNFNSVSSSHSINMDIGSVCIRGATNASNLPCSSLSGARLIFSVTYYA
jgi:hypothetical protein